MQQRVQTFHRRAKPSSDAQLPITAALHAEHLTLFGIILHQVLLFVNPHFDNCLSVWREGSFVNAESAG